MKNFLKWITCKYFSLKMKNYIKYNISLRKETLNTDRKNK